MVNLAYGVTTARDPQSMDINIFTYADRVAVGDMIGPRVFTTGPGIFNNSPVNNLEDAKKIGESRCLSASGACKSRTIIPSHRFASNLPIAFAETTSP